MHHVMKCLNNYFLIALRKRSRDVVSMRLEESVPLPLNITVVFHLTLVFLFCLSSEDLKIFSIGIDLIQ